MHYRHCNALNALVQALVFPHIRYCLTVWGNCSATLKARVQKVINFGARIVYGLGRRDHVTPALKELRWPSTRCARKSRVIA